MKINYEYLKDSSFLLQLAKERNVELFVKIIVLTMQDKPIKEIQGRVLGGSINVDGNSAVRRTGALSVFIEEKDASYMEIGGLFSLNKKVSIEIGMINPTRDYSQYPIIWFPQGVFAIVNLSSSHSTTGTTVDIQIKDKMVFLNGECGGTIPASTIFDEYEILDAETGTYIIEKPSIIQIIYELVSHFGGEQMGKIIVSDIDTRIKKVMKWSQSGYLYFYITNDGSAEFSQIPFREEDSKIIQKTLQSIDEEEARFGVFKEEDFFPEDWILKKAEHDKIIKELEAIITEEQGLINGLGRKPAEGEEFPYILKNVYTTGDDVGYIYSDFYFPRELVGNAGDTVCTILDTIKNTLGNFEYFYDLNGNFIFREIKNYLNTTQATHALKSEDASNYLIDRSKGKAEYNFEDSSLITSYSHSPNYANVKNDFIVWGMRETVGGRQLPIRYHLAIDSKPQTGNVYQCYFYDDPESIDLETLEPIKKVRLPIEFDTPNLFPEIGELGKVYYSKGKGYYWDKSKPIILDKAAVDLNPTDFPPYEEVEVDHIDADGDGVTDKVIQYHSYYHPASLKNIVTKDWREELFFSGVNTSRFGNDSNSYYTELENEWIKLYDYDKAEPTWREEVLNDASGLDYFLDFIDSAAEISEFSISNIGRRTHIVSDDSINCIFEPEIPDYILIESGKDISADIEEAESKGQKWISVSPGIYNGIIQGGSHNSAYNMIKDLLYQYTGYNGAITLQTLPMYFLEPNIRISVRNDKLGIYGDYMLNNFSIPLDIGSTMSLSCTKVLERI